MFDKKRNKKKRQLLGNIGTGASQKGHVRLQYFYLNIHMVANAKYRRSAWVAQMIKSITCFQIQYILARVLIRFDLLELAYL
jgi:hypothetical protein